MAHRPALDPRSVPAVSRSGYPEPYRSRVLPRERRALGDALGLTRIGINQTTLLPGKESSMRHWHTREDEFVYVLDGEVVLRTDAGEQRLTAGMCAGFPAGRQDGHQLVNRSDRPAVYLEVSNRDPEDVGNYSDPNVDLVWNPPQARGGYTRRDGTRY
ncbi:MAG TPA: cupin domain-containing protein [Steroidobacteraceae bacterium]|nr:cupin domain-containing protein [Steroidobacteraceae bacterium]